MMILAPPLPRRSLAQAAYDSLRRAIVRGELAPGSRLVETRIAEALRMSRTPVREAIHKLEREGLLSRHPQGGFYVVGFSREDIEEIFGIRSVLESYAARLAAEQTKERDLVPLEEAIEEFQRHMDRGESSALPAINTRFHDLLYAMSGSPRLIKMINDIRDPIYRFRTMILKIHNMAVASNEDHRVMVDLIRRGDGEAVETLVKAHILRGRDVVLRELEPAVEKISTQG